MIDYATLSYGQMAEIVSNISKEVKNRNPLFVNNHVPAIIHAANTLQFLHERKQNNPEFDEQ